MGPGPILKANWKVHKWCHGIWAFLKIHMGYLGPPYKGLLVSLTTTQNMSAPISPPPSPRDCQVAMRRVVIRLTSGLSVWIPRGGCSSTNKGHCPLTTIPHWPLLHHNVLTTQCTHRAWSQISTCPDLCGVRWRSICPISVILYNWYRIRFKCGGFIVASLILPKGVVQMTSHIQKYICPPFCLPLCDSLLEGVGVYGFYMC